MITPGRHLCADTERTGGSCKPLAKPRNRPRDQEETPELSPEDPPRATSSTSPRTHKELHPERGLPYTRPRMLSDFADSQETRNHR
ncbi:hypothetical protein Nepgr_016831 [Nepenthes gracilis]|uniref:Uncharacterized protein n=1 Tax=Nepenthes gracilis TaxID=150966 RepID=A0AAD3SNB4_NEPGR|nr:hypothetical protein Nepgr_016831 [Nepenthes gracilis]